jgi:hypothetical protein
VRRARGEVVSVEEFTVAVHIDAQPRP